jgi:hypothetical protein
MIKKAFLLLVAWEVFSTCHKIKPEHIQPEDRQVTCIQQKPYAYLHQYPIDSVDTSPICRKYQEIWKALLLEKSHLSEKFFEDHITPVHSGMQPWNDGISFEICFKVHIDWAVAYQCDQFIVRIDSANKLYPSLALPRDVYLSKDQIRLATSARAFSSVMHRVSGARNIKFSSMDDALHYLIRAAKVNTLCVGSVHLNGTGDLVLEAGASYVHRKNTCITAIVDLANRDCTTTNGPCMIN